MSHAIDPFADPDMRDWGATLALARAELDALEAVLPAATDAQWTAAPRARPQEDTSERPSDHRSDPTFSTVADSARWQLRAQLVRSVRIVRESIIAVRGVRRGVEIALAEWEGNGDEPSISVRADERA